MGSYQLPPSVDIFRFFRLQFTARKLSVIFLRVYLSKHLSLRIFKSTYLSALHMLSKFIEVSIISTILLTYCTSTERAVRIQVLERLPSNFLKLLYKNMEIGSSVETCRNARKQSISGASIANSKIIVKKLHRDASQERIRIWGVFQCLYIRY